MKSKMVKSARRVREWLGALSFRTGVVIAAACVCCYALSFLQMLLPIGVGAKGVLWATFYGLAKACQYTAILILGKEGVARLKSAVRQRGKSSGDVAARGAETSPAQD